MPKWVYDNKTMTMVPQQKRGIDYALTGEGLRITDHDRRVEFVITRNNECRRPGRGMRFDCKLYDTHTARQIAGRVQRIYPQSKYKDWRFFAKGFNDPYDFDIEEQMTSEDKALLRSISESYEPGNVLEYVEHLNEETGVLFNVGHTASTEHNFKDHKEGIPGLLQALPSMAFSFFVCPPAALLALIGAIHRRSEQRWAKSIFNHNRWKDLVAYPVARQKLREKIAENCKYYYTRLANGEILRVVGCSTLEAKEMIMAIEKKDIMERYKQYNDNLTLTKEGTPNIQPFADENKKYIMWVIKFDDGEACYAFGKEDASDKEDIMKDAVKSREAMVDFYKKIVYKDEDNKERKKQTHRVGIDKEKDEMTEQEKRLFAVPKIDDMIRIDNPTSYKIIDESNYKDFTEPTTSQLRWEPAGKTVYRFTIGDVEIPFMRFTLPLNTNLEAKTVCEYILQEERSFSQTMKEIITFLENNRTSISYYKCMTENRGDYVYLPVHSGNGSIISNKGTNFEIDEHKASEVGNKLFDSISEAIDEKNVINPKISTTVKNDYASNYKKGNRITNTTITSIGDPDEEGDINNLYENWKATIKYSKVDSRTGETIDGPILFSTAVNNKPAVKRRSAEPSKQEEPKNEKPIDTSTSITQQTTKSEEHEKKQQVSPEPKTDDKKSKELDKEENKDNQQKAVI